MPAPPRGPSPPRRRRGHAEAGGSTRNGSGRLHRASPETLFVRLTDGSEACRAPERERRSSEDDLRAGRRGRRGRDPRSARAESGGGRRTRRAGALSPLPGGVSQPHRGVCGDPLERPADRPLGAPHRGRVRRPPGPGCLERRRLHAASSCRVRGQRSGRTGSARGRRRPRRPVSCPVCASHPAGHGGIRGLTRDRADLLEHGADTTLPAPERTPLDTARANGDEVLVALLEATG